MVGPLNPTKDRRTRDAAWFGAGAAAMLLMGAADPYARLDTLARVLSDVEAQYERPLSLSSLVDAALHGIGGSLDEHSGYFTAAEWTAIKERSAGRSGDVGATLIGEECGLRVVAVLANSPADRAAMVSGDCVVAIDGVPTHANTPASALDGPDGSVVRVQVGGTGADRERVILRGRVSEPAVSFAHLDGGILHVRVRNFDNPVTAMFSQHVGAAETVRGLILDVRGNPGGRIEEAALFVDRFVSAGTIVVTRRRTGAETESKATAESTDLRMPVVVLIDGDTASAAEIVAGALRDLGRAKLVGRTSYGKGSVQNQILYDDGSALKLTVGRYFLPSGKPIVDRQGLIPDVLVPPGRPGEDSDITTARALLQSSISAGR